MYLYIVTEERIAVAASKFICILKTIYEIKVRMSVVWALLYRKCKWLEMAYMRPRNLGHCDENLSLAQKTDIAVT